MKPYQHPTTNVSMFDMNVHLMRGSKSNLISGNANESIYFTHNELVAITKMSKAMATADGKLDANELFLIANELSNNSSQEKILDEADFMNSEYAISIIKDMTADKKKYVCGFLAAISASDGHVDAKEVAVWQLVSTLASFPPMTFDDALRYWKSH